MVKADQKGVSFGGSNFQKEESFKFTITASGRNGFGINNERGTSFGFWKRGLPSNGETCFRGEGGTANQSTGIVIHD